MSLGCGVKRGFKIYAQRLKSHNFNDNNLESLVKLLRKKVSYCTTELNFTCIHNNVFRT